MKVGLKDINKRELETEQHIRIFDKEDHKYVVKDAIIKYESAAFIIYPTDGSHKLLLHWYVRNDIPDTDNIMPRDKFEIEIIA